jgi:CDP-glucose 4,6-dehydratase
VKRVVVASSDKAYGEVQVLPYVEEMPLNGRHPYDVSKSCTDLLALAYASTYDLPVTVARCGNIFGGGDLNWSRIVPGTIRSALEGKAPILRSNGLYTRDYLYVEDAVEAYLRLAEATPTPSARGEAFNFSLEERTTVLDITRAILEAVGRPDLQPVILDQAKAEIPDQALDASKARQRLGWAARYPVPEGLRRTVLWYRSFFSRSADEA